MVMFMKMRKSWGPEMSVLIPAALIYTFACFGAELLNSAHVYLVEQAVCREYYMLYEPGMVQMNGLVDEEVCKLPEVEIRVASIYGIYNAVWYLPTLFLTGPYRKIGSLLGKRTVIFMNLSSFTIAKIYFVSICYFYQTFDIRWIYLAPFFDIFGGGRVILYSFLSTYIVESTSSKQLSGVLYKLSAVQLLLTFFSLVVSSFTLRENVWLQCVTGIACSAILIPFALLLPSSRKAPSPDERQLTDEELEIINNALKDSPDSEINEETSLLSSHSNPAVMTEKPLIIPTIFHALSTHHIHTLSFFKGIFASSHITRATLLTYFILVLGLSVHVVFAQWSSITYDWIFADVAALMSFEMVVSGVVLLSLPPISAWLARRTSIGRVASVDLFVAKASVLVIALGLLLLGFAPTRTAYVVATAVFTLGSGITDSLKSFATARVATDEIDELYLGIGMMETLGGIIATVGWSSLLAGVLGKGYWLERIPFVASAGVMVGVFGCVVMLGRAGRKKAAEDVVGMHATAGGDV